MLPSFPGDCHFKVQAGGRNRKHKKSCYSAGKLLRKRYPDTKIESGISFEWVQIIIALYILIVMILLTVVSAETSIISPTKPNVIDLTK